MYSPKDILLYDSKSQPLIVYDNSPAPEEGLYFSPLQWENLGRFSPSLLYSPIGDGQQDVNQYDREMLLRVSRKLYATMPEVAAASSQLANLTIGLGSNPLFKGDDPEDLLWGETTEMNLECNFYNSCTPYGIAFDWRTFWKLVSFLCDRDGDVGLVPFTDRNGILKMTVYESHRIGNRPGQLTVDGGKFDGAIIRDGVVLSPSNYPLGYQVMGSTSEDDRVYSTAQMFLIYNPFSFSKFRGLPAIVSAMRSAASLQEIFQGIEMTCKIHSQIFLQVKNEMGQAPRSKIKTLGGNVATNTNTSAGYTKPVYEDTYGGIRYVRHKDEINSFSSQTPSDQTMKFVEHLEKGILLGTGIPFQWILNPESVSGASSRGIKEQIVRATQARGQMLGKYQTLMITKAVASGMINGTIPENYKTDTRTGQPVFTQWEVSQAAELMLDVGYEKQADVTAYLTGLMSADEILQKYGKRYKKTLNTREKNVRQLLATVRTIQKDFPEFATAILPLMQKEDFVMPGLPPEQTDTAKETV